MDRVVEVDLKQILQACLRKWWLIVLMALALAVAVYMYTALFVTPQYQTGASFYVNNSQQSGESQKISSSDLATSQRLVLTYVNIIKSDSVLEKVIGETELKMTPSQIRSMMTAESIDETEMFRVQISHKDPVLAARIANAIADVAPAEISNIMVGSTTKVVDRAKVPTAPVNPNKSQNALLGGLAGAVLAVIIVTVQTLMDVRVKSEEDLTAISALPVLGAIPEFTEESKSSYAAPKTEKAGRR